MKFLFALLIIFVNYAISGARANVATSTSQASAPLDQNIFPNNKKHHNNENVHHSINVHNANTENDFSHAFEMENRNQNQNTNHENQNRLNINYINSTDKLHKPENHVKTHALRQMKKTHVRKPLMENSAKHPTLIAENAARTQHLPQNAKRGVAKTEFFRPATKESGKNSFNKNQKRHVKKVYHSKTQTHHLKKPNNTIVHFGGTAEKKHSKIHSSNGNLNKQLNNRSSKLDNKYKQKINGKNRSQMHHDKLSDQLLVNNKHGIKHYNGGRSNEKNYLSKLKNGDDVPLAQTNPAQSFKTPRIKQMHSHQNNLADDNFDTPAEHLVHQMKFLNPFNVNQLKPQKAELFLDFEDIPKQHHGQLIRHNHKCKHFELSEMKLVKIENKHGHVNTFYVFPKPISGGATSKVFHASPIDAVDMDGKALTNCVAIKSVILEFDNASPDVIEGFEREEQFLMMFRNNPNIKHIVHLHYMKKDYAKNRLIIILELGKHDLTKRMQLMRTKWKLYWGSTAVSVDHQIVKLLRQVLEAVNEMHGKTIHLDLKSDNLLFVEDYDDSGHKIGEILKVIDFGGSEFIDPLSKKSNEATEVANVCRVRKGMWSDDRYSSPEQNTSCGKASQEGTLQYTVSTKSDVWSFGIMLVEFLLLRPNFPEIDPIADRKSSDANNIYNVVLRINNWHYAVASEFKESKYVMHYMNKIHELFPKFYSIIKACLRVDPKQRPTAKGILDFLNGKCQFKHFGKEKAAAHWRSKQIREFGKRKIRSVHSIYEGKHHGLFSREIYGEQAVEVEYCDLGKINEMII